jgi:hypothetical protein
MGLGSRYILPVPDFNADYNPFDPDDYNVRSKLTDEGLDPDSYFVRSVVTDEGVEAALASAEKLKSRPS